MRHEVRLHMEKLKQKLVFRSIFHNFMSLRAMKFGYIRENSKYYFDFPLFCTNFMSLCAMKLVYIRENSKYYFDFPLFCTNSVPRYV